MHSIEPTVHSIIFNLIDNAIKYTPHQGVINISVYTDPDNYACIQIEDSGAGIDPENYDKVLKRFYRVPPSGSRKWFRFINCRPCNSKTWWNFKSRQEFRAWWSFCFSEVT